MNAKKASPICSIVKSFQNEITKKGFKKLTGLGKLVQV